MTDVVDKVVRLPNRALAREQAAEWLARVDRGLSGEERVAVTEWLADPVQRQEFLELASLWDDLDVLGELSALFPLPPVEARDPRGQSFGRVPALRASLAAAAALAVCGVLVIALIRDDAAPPARIAAAAPPAAETPAPAVEQRFATVVGEHETRRLPDGSIVTLNTDTEIRFDFAGGAREVHLIRGEAHFVAAHDSDTPFRVHVGGRVVHAIGTAFNVHLRSAGDVEVTVTEGTVKVLREKHMKPEWTELPRDFRLPDDVVVSPVADATLVAGDAARFDRDLREILHLEPSEMDVKLAWQRGMLIFRGEPLADILDEVSRYTTVEFKLEDAALGSVRVGGFFHAGDVEGLLDALRENFQIDSEVLAADLIVLRNSR